MRFLTEQIITNAAMTQSLTSSVVDLNQMIVFAVQAVYSGSPSGTLSLQASCDNVPSANQVVNWTTIANSAVNITTAGSSSWNYSLVGYRWVQAIYTFSSGSGTLNITLNAKG